MATGDGCHHSSTHLALVAVVRGGGQIHDQSRALVHQVFDRVHWVQALRPKVFIVPCIFADGDGNAFASHFIQSLLRRRSKVSLLIEHVVIRQQHLRLDEFHAAIAQQHCRVHDPLARIGRSRGGTSAENSNRMIGCDSLGNFLDRLLRARQE